MEDLIFRTGLAGVRCERPLQIQSSADARHVNTVEFRLIQRILQLDQASRKKLLFL